ncbi:MAG: outer membrane lipoprotein-sorting protein [Candidatus Binatia bacterium]
MYRLFAAVITLTLIASPSVAAPPDVMTIVKQMKEVFAPTGSRTQKVVISTTSDSGEKVEWIAAQARKQLPDGKRTLLVMLAPTDLKGTTLLIGEQQGLPDVMWWYPPALDRVRKLVPVMTSQDFLDTDFTLADLGFISRQGTYKLLGEEELNGMRTYKIELVPEEQWYYSRIITWVAADSMLPLRRDFHDRTGKLWRSEFFEKIAPVNGIPTPLLIRMQDVQQGTSTEFRVSEVQTNVDVPDALFDPKQLPQAADSPLWQGYFSPQVAEKK